MTGALLDHKKQGNTTPENNGTQNYCVLYKKAGIPWKLHSFENCFVRRSNQVYVKDRLGGTLGNRDDAVNHYQKYEKK